MADAIESQIGILTHGRQTTRGQSPVLTDTTALTTRARWTDGILDQNKTLGESDYVDGLPFGSPQTYTDQTLGEVGSVTAQVQPSNAGLFFAELAGVDVVTGSTDPYTHTIAFTGATQPYGWWFTKVSQNVTPTRAVFYDSKLGKGTFESSADSKVLTAELSVIALAQKNVIADPAQVETTDDSYLHSESSGSFSLDGTVICEVGSDVFDVDRGLGVFWGDSSTAPCQIVPGKGQITRTVQTIATGDTVLKRNQAIYGTASPADNAVPVRDVYYMAITKTLTRSATRSLTINTPKVAVVPADMKIGPSPDGGPVEMTFGGRCLKSGAAAPATVIVKDGNSAAYV